VRGVLRIIYGSHFNSSYIHHETNLDLNPLMRTLLLTALVLISFLVQSQPKTIDAAKINVQWEVIENSHQSKSQFLSAFTFTNEGKEDIPATGWTLYFNFVRAVDPASVTGGVMIERVNGDFFKLYPKPDFKGIKAGASLRVEFVSSDWVVNFTDAPAGIYIVWDSAPDKGMVITNYNIKPSTEPKQYLRFPGDKIGLVTPAALYDQNRKTWPVTADKLVKIFPTPVSYREEAGSFALAKDIAIVTDASFRKEADILAADLFTIFKTKPAVTTSGGNAKKIIQMVKNTLPAEAYQLRVTADKITIAAATASGIFYGIQSLKSLFPAAAWAKAQTTVAIPLVTVEDAPRFSHRAFFLDVSRNFQRKEQILKVLDLMALYKLNVFHFHLNDDEGWRLEIPALPELTEIGSKRGHSLTSSSHLPPSYGSGPDINNPYGTGYYSKADYIEILKYATARHIRVIPEIETPGHARAAVKSMAPI
jgi:hexosaminidase